jgi:hypothetical protein
LDFLYALTISGIFISLSASYTSDPRVHCDFRCGSGSEKSRLPSLSCCGGRYTHKLTPPPPISTNQATYIHNPRHSKIQSYLSTQQPGQRSLPSRTVSFRPLLLKGITSHVRPSCFGSGVMLAYFLCVLRTQHSKWRARDCCCTSFRGEAECSTDRMI